MNGSPLLWTCDAGISRISETLPVLSEGSHGMCFVSSRVSCFFVFFVFLKKKLFAVSAPAPGQSFFTVGCKIFFLPRLPDVFMH